MPKTMPLDIKEVLDTVANLGQARDLPVYIDLVFDVTADDRLIDYILNAFMESGSDAFFEQVLLEDQVPEIPVPADLCVLVAGESLLLGDVAAAARRKGIPTVIVIEEGKTFFSEKKEGAARSAASSKAGSASAGGKGIPLDDIVSIRLDDDGAHPLEALGHWIVTRAPAKRISMADDFPFLRHPLAIETVYSTAIQNGAIGVVVFVPGADMPLITLNQSKMVLQIASIYGQALDRDRAKEIALVVASGFGFRAIARELSDLVPGVGWAVKGGIGYSATLAMGYAAIDHFEDGGHISALADVLGKAVDKVVDVVDERL